MRFLSLGFLLVAACNCPKFQQQQPRAFTVSYVQCAAPADAGDAASDASDDDAEAGASDASAPFCFANCDVLCSQQPHELGVGQITCTGSAPGDAGDTIAQCLEEPGPVDPPACL